MGNIVANEPMLRAIAVFSKRLDQIRLVHELSHRAQIGELVLDRSRCLPFPNPVIHQPLDVLVPNRPRRFNRIATLLPQLAHCGADIEKAILLRLDAQRISAAPRPTDYAVDVVLEQRDEFAFQPRGERVAPDLSPEIDPDTHTR
ncbi:hypothetical protein CBM2633_P90051 [Cupriavidus taiwanensis]|uniref:Uncharacterized protein n=2 Tax=Cupriavidus TaxID=106589 RepID=A0A375CPS4_9BURK|nr:hypothetical protein CBM2585_P90052 [Cupriavidus taiwanensis]SPD62181.1 protein of unknown function [Cupriavidus neocaledonicus]SOY77429.1 hypothetical protein CBM2589_P90052 [Cupriavidus taiwanensis]SOY98978.1 hypothetical protein CBM2591_P120052 [Cupriavidus taiwanensis]SOZ07196.1 hypothetical protein CBM2599_P80024 [Cupriavidus taiwanensis]